MAGQANRRPPESGRTNTSTIVLLVPLVFSAVVGVLWAIALGSHLRRSLEDFLIRSVIGEIRTSFWETTPDLCACRNRRASAVIACAELCQICPSHSSRSCVATRTSSRRSR